jgi:hypothetical protein
MNKGAESPPPRPVAVGPLNLIDLDGRAISQSFSRTRGSKRGNCLDGDGWPRGFAQEIGPALFPGSVILLAFRTPSSVGADFKDALMAQGSVLVDFQTQR